MLACADNSDGGAPPPLTLDDDEGRPLDFERRSCRWAEMDGGGGFSVQLAPGRWVLEASSDGCPSVHQSISVAAGAATELVLEPSARGFIEGIVVVPSAPVPAEPLRAGEASSDEEPSASIALSLRGPWSTEHLEVPTAGGPFAFKNVGSGERVLSASHPRLGAWTGWVRAGDRGVRVVLERPVFRGIVTWVTGQPAAGVAVRAEHISGTEVFETRTDAHGAFRLPVEALAAHWVVASAPRGLAEIRAAPSNEELRLVLEDAIAFTARVVDLPRIGSGEHFAIPLTIAATTGLHSAFTARSDFWTGFSGGEVRTFLAFPSAGTRLLVPRGVVVLLTPSTVPGLVVTETVVPVLPVASPEAPASGK